MPLPENGNIEWPPKDQAAAIEAYARYGAWYGGDPDELARVYGAGGGLAGPDLRDIPSGGVISALQRGMHRMFWGTMPPAGQVRQHKLHIPLAGDIAATSADLLFGEPPEVVIPDSKPTDPTNERLGEILDESNAHAVWLEAAEIGAAYGGSYVRVRWDPEVAECPLFEALPPDVAIPEFRSGRLVAVTLWRNLSRPDSRHWRHLERHEKGRVFHGLYVSHDAEKLGRPLPLQEHEDTAPFAELVDADGGFATGATGLAVEYIPNMRPNKVMRGSPLGRSDYAGIMPILDALDEAWTSWLRDLRLGKGRLVVPRSYIQGAGRGKGATFDAEREIFEAVDALTSPDGGLAMQIVQFAIRVDEHSRTCTEITKQAVRAAGYSAQTFGEQGDVAMTATESTDRQSASFRTRTKKILYARGPLARIIRAALEIDVAQFRKAGVKADALPTLEWPDGVAVDPMQSAQTLQLLAAAEAASIRERVRRLNPDWEDADIDKEVVRIKEDMQAAAPPVAPPGAASTGHGPDDGPSTAPGGKNGAGDDPPAASSAGSGDKSSPRPAAAGATNGKPPAVPAKR